MKKLVLFTTLAMTLVTGSAMATMMTLSISPDTTPTQTALQMQATDVMSPMSVNLNDGEGVDFTAFFLGTGEACVNGDELVSSAWTVVWSGTFGTESFGGETSVSTIGTFSAGGFYQGLYFSGGNDIFHFSEGDLSITLYEASVSYPFFQGPNGPGDGGTFVTGTASFTANGGGAPVPEPATMLLFGTGLLGLIGFGHTRKKKV